MTAQWPMTHCVVTYIKTLALAFRFLATCKKVDCKVPRALPKGDGPSVSRRNQRATRPLQFAGFFGTKWFDEEPSIDSDHPKRACHDVADHGAVAGDPGLNDTKPRSLTTPASVGVGVQNHRLGGWAVTGSQLLSFRAVKRV